MGTGVSFTRGKAAQLEAGYLSQRSAELPELQLFPYNERPNKRFKFLLWIEPFMESCYKHWPQICIRSPLFWDFKQRRFELSHRRLATVYQFHLQGSNTPRRLPDLCKWERLVIPKRRPEYNLRCVTSKKSEHLIYTAVETWNYIYFNIIRYIHT
jgi:hypothetical protein